MYTAKTLHFKSTRMFSAHRVGSNSLSVKNLVLLFFTIVLGFASVITLAQISIPSTIENARQTIAKITITESGTDSAPLIEMSSGGIFIDATILDPQTNFSGKVLGIDDLGNVIYVYSQSLVTSGGGGMGGGTGDGYWTGVGNNIYNLNTDNVGIGTSTMSGKLHIKSVGQTELYLEETSGASAANIHFTNVTRSRAVGAYSTPYDVFYIGRAGSGADFFITALGLVGIGTHIPKANLQVIGTVIAGDYSNNISGANSTIGGGSGNIMTGDVSFIGGGKNNKIDGTQSFIGGGYGNRVVGNNSAIVVGGQKTNKIINADNSFIGAGQGNIISGGEASIVGGASNIIYDFTHGFIGGGEYNNIYGIPTTGSFYATIAGGFMNTIDGFDYGFIGGGQSNLIIGASDSASIVGGNTNTINGSSNGFIGGGKINIITGNSNYGVIVGGNTNTINGSSNGFVGGGNKNTINGSSNGFVGGGSGNNIAGNSNYSVIVGGENNVIQNATHSFVGGINAKAYYNNSFVRNSNSAVNFTGTKPGQFIINAPYIKNTQGGVGINTNNPQAELEVNGEIIAGRFIGDSLQIQNNIAADTIQLYNSTTNTGAACTAAGQILYKSGSFYGCNGSVRKKLDN